MNSVDTVFILERRLTTKLLLPGLLLQIITLRSTQKKNWIKYLKASKVLKIQVPGLSYKQNFVFKDNQGQNI